jgi:SAM-dependent methyltransferase
MDMPSIYEDGTFDISGSQNGVSLFPDLPQGLREMVRVTKPGGRVLIVAFGSLRKAEFLRFFLDAIQAVVPGFTGLSMDPPPLPFQVADPEKLRQQMVNAGLADVHVKTTTWRMEFQTGTEMWDVVTSSNPIGSMLVANLADTHGTAAQRALDDMLRERAGGTGRAVLTNEMNIGLGTK